MSKMPKWSRPLQASALAAYENRHLPGYENRHIFLAGYENRHMDPDPACYYSCYFTTPSRYYEACYYVFTTYYNEQNHYYAT